MAQTRQLAAIMFTDIVGYTALMGNDEGKAFAILLENRQLQKPLIEKHGGRWIKELGDGVLASFPTVSDAVQAAIDIQQQCSRAARFSLRIGIHQGEIVFEDDDVFGDAVNVASRIQALAPPGGIWISESVHYNTVNKPGITTRYVKRERLKNVKEPVRIYAVDIEGGLAPREKAARHGGLTRAGTKRNMRPLWGTLILLVLLGLGYFAYTAFIRKEQAAFSESNGNRSIAVLPFENRSNDKAQEYFSDGLSEELLNLLSRVPGLRVIARTSSFSFKGKNEDIRTISEKLGVAHILEGSVRRSGKQLRITAQLIRASDGVTLWSQTYNRAEDDVFKIQDEVAASVVRELKVKLVPAAQHGSATSNIEAYNLLLQGNHFYDKLDKENVLKSIEFYKRALAIDSTYAKAWATLARSYSRLSWNNFIEQNVGYEMAREAALKAVALDENSVDGLRALGAVKFYHDFDWAGSEVVFRKALELEPSNAEVLSVYAVWHQTQGLLDRALALNKEAISYDPLKPLFYSIYGNAFTYAARYEEGLRMFAKALELNPAFQDAWSRTGRIYLLQGQPERALAAIKKETSEVRRSFALCAYYSAAGRKKEADEALQAFINKYGVEWPYMVACIYGYRNDADAAMTWLEKAFQRKDSWLVYVKGEPLLKRLRTDPRFQQFLKRMNLPADEP